jgi:hypothetical protein
MEPLGSCRFSQNATPDFAARGDGDSEPCLGAAE